jgi:iron complex outermembrane receptor protein
MFLPKRATPIPTVMPHPTPSSALLLLVGIHSAIGAPSTSTGTQNTQSNAESGTFLSEVVVIADKLAFYTPENFGGTRLDIPLREVPQSIRVVDKQLLQDVTAVRVQDSFDYVSGVSYQNAFGGLWENYAMRGFTGDSNNAGLAYLLNGFSSNRGFNAPRDTANVESIEFLKGPTAALFGAGDPGGTLNVMTKRPLWTSRHEIQTLFGSFDFFRQTLDTTGPLNKNLAYRFNFAHEDANSFRNSVGSNRLLFAPAFTLKISDSTTLDYTGEWLEQTVDFDRGVFAINRGTPTNPNFQLGAVPRGQFYGEPNDEPIRSSNILNQVRLKHELNEDWFLRLGLASKINSLKGFASETRNIVATGNEMRRRYRYRDYQSDDWNLQAEIAGKFETYGVEHQLLYGLESYWFETDQTLLSGNYATNLNLLNPVYGQAKPSLSSIIDRTENQRGLALFLHDQLSLGKWRLLLGVRYDRFDQRVDDRRYNFVSEQEQHAWTPRVGLTWLPTETVSVFSTYSHSFRPNAGTDSQLRAFDPERGRALDAGVKYQSKDGRVGATLAVFDIHKKNVLRFDPADPLGLYMLGGGEAASRGIEFDISGQLTKGLRLSSSFTYQHAKIVKSDAIQPGSRLLNIPRVMANALLVREFELGRAGKLGVGAGVVHMGERPGRDGGGFDLPEYTTAKALGYWQPNKNLSVTLDVENLFDKTFYASSINEHIVQPGAPRTVMVGVRVTF